MSTTTFRSVALLGATGNLGSKILAALNTAGYTVTAIQRKDSKNVASGAANSLKVDLTSESGLTEAFKGQDVVVSAVPNPVLATEKVWMDAAVSAGVKRIVLSEYSTNLETKLSQALPIVKDKLEIRKYAETLGSSGKIGWSSVNGGPFFVPFIWTSGWMGANPKTKKASYHDGGNKIVCTSTLERIGESVAKILAPEHAAETKNKSIYTYSAPVSERKITDIIAKITGSNFSETNSSIDEVTKDAFAAFEKGDMSKMMHFYIPFCFGDGYGGDFRDQAWNEKLGLKEMSDKEVEDMFRSFLSKKNGA
ncbi:putative pinoresinol-lariciresinol reductase [Lachnellula suecica]|uniref:Putative pinoresinol-lariciresinol reductase n=1 Tax=Lachnellula suecica TaxID=602035 RepID=A0A8T9CAP9_9HELO|nr:putative pinoresinol-lariciresinol reductase [Lachnellula suecica]